MPEGGGHDVVPVNRELIRGAADAAAAGFMDNEIWVWMLPRPWQLRRILPRHYRAMIKRVFMPRGGAWTTADTKGAALWFPPGTQKFTLREQLTQLRSLLPEGVTCLPKGAKWDELVLKHRPREPHWYLNTLSVAPGVQGQGIGSALIQPGLERADAEGLGCYLETQRRRNIPFYRRFGFEETGEISLDDSPPLWLMWRPPQT